MANRGFLSSMMQSQSGNEERDMICYGLLCEEISRGSGSLLSLLTVHGMVSRAISRWGTRSQKETWLPKLAHGRSFGAFGLSEPMIGSDAKNVRTQAIASNNSYILNGKKKWISGGLIADVYIIIAQCEGKPTAFIVERNTPGFSVSPIKDMLGFRSAMLAELIMDNCVVPKNNLIGKVGTGFSHIAATALDHGRYSIAWGSIGIAQACLDACIEYTNKRMQFNVYLKEHQLIQKMISDMVVKIKAGRLLCCHAGYLQNTSDPSLIMETSIAKYFTSKIAMESATDAVQIHGANGCSGEYSVQRYFRDAKIMEIIEGSNQIQQMIISRYVLR
jgi:alkylation response protein AidB-like acyl-CoA dehydrogenase